VRCSFLCKPVSQFFVPVRRSAKKDQLRIVLLIVLSHAKTLLPFNPFLGCVRKKNVQNTMLKNLLDACGAALAWYTTGYAFAFGETGSGETSFIGTGGFLYIGDVDAAYWFFQYAFSATAVTIVAGTLAERCQMTAYLLYSLFLTGFVYPISARAMWSSHGFLSAKQPDPLGGVGAIDFAGSGVVHITGGMTALIAAKILGARKGRFYDSKGSPLSKPKDFPGHSIALQLMGTMMLWFGCK
jgi:Amt family ammonium transporter